MPIIMENNSGCGVLTYSDDEVNFEDE